MAFRKRGMALKKKQRQMRDGFRKGKKREGFKKRVTALEKKKEGGI